jgi:predicted acyl esterase
MSDGVRLAADLYVPEGYDALDDVPDPLPVVLEYMPYRKDDMVAGSRFYEPLVHGRYAVMRVDVRGSGSSGGITTDEYLPQEQQDGYETVEWLAAQPWCDGSVNVMGFSYSGFTALQIAATQPPHLTTIIPGYFTDDRYTDDCHYSGGFLRQYYDVLFYGTFMIAYNALPPSTEALGDEWPEAWRQHLEHNEPYLLQWLRHQTDGPYWRLGSVRDVLDRIQCPIFMIAGWQDGYPNPPLRLLEGLQVPHRLLVGPWSHAQPDEAVPGPRIDYVHEVLRWLDYWCRGIDTGIAEEPPIAVFVQRFQEPAPDRIESAGEWRAEVSWPPPGATEQILHLGAGDLSEPSAQAGEDVLNHVPSVGTSGGLWSGGVPFGLAGDQRADEQDLTILGRARLVLHASFSAPVAGIVARLCDVAPDGQVQLVAKGALNATRRDSLTEPSPLVPGERYELELELDATAWRFVAGHRFRMSLTNADWPNLWPTPYRSTTRIFRGPGTPSRLVLPIVPAKGSAPPPAFRPSTRTVSSPAAWLTPPTWRVARDPLTRTATVTIEWESRSRGGESTVVERRYELVTEVRDDDPAAARARGRHVSRLHRGGRIYAATSEVSIEASESSFDVVIALDVEVDDRMHHQRRWHEIIGRELL